MHTRSSCGTVSYCTAQRSKHVLHVAQEPKLCGGTHVAVIRHLVTRVRLGPVVTMQGGGGERVGGEVGRSDHFMNRSRPTVTGCQQFN
jgi:hypothetical protein